MAKLTKTQDRELEKLKAEWRKSRKKIVLAKALTRCRDHHLREPAWLHEAQHGLGRKLIMGMKKTGRPTDLKSDDVLFATIEHYREHGLTLDKSLVSSAREIYSDERRYFTVKSAWLRHRQRITKWVHAGGLGWGFKPEHIRQDKNAAIAEVEVPDWLKDTKKQ